MDGWLGLVYQRASVQEYASQTIIFGSRYTIAHGLGAVPRLDRIIVTMKCTTSEKNYEVGDEIAAPIVTHFSSAAGGFGGNVQADCTNVLL